MKDRLRNNKSNNYAEEKGDIECKNATDCNTESCQPSPGGSRRVEPVSLAEFTHPSGYGVCSFHFTHTSDMQ